jgi:hypothetical protein
MTVEEDFGTVSGTSACAECGASFDTETYREEDDYSTLEQDSYVVDWQIAE